MIIVGIISESLTYMILLHFLKIFIAIILLFIVCNDIYSLFIVLNDAYSLFTVLNHIYSLFIVSKDNFSLTQLS